MDGSDSEIEPAALLVPRRRRRRWRLAAGLVVLLIILGFALVWGSRETLVGNYIGRQLVRNGLVATYKIEKIGPRHQILRDVVIGNPLHPDLTIDKVEVAIRYRLGYPTIGQVVALRPRLYGSLHGGKLSFGSLDKVLFEGGKPGKKFRLPKLDVEIADGRGLIDSDWGPIGVKLEGAGKLRGGFAGTLAAIAPQATVNGCALTRASLYGAVNVMAERLRFNGPFRVSALTCPNGTRLAMAGLRVDALLDKNFDGGEAKFGLDTGPSAIAGLAAEALRGSGSVAYRNNSLTSRYQLAASGAQTGTLAAADLRTEGSLRSQDGLRRIELDGSLGAAEVALGPALNTSLASAERATAGTLLAPMLGQVRQALVREAAGSRLAASYLARFTEAGTSLVIPQASLRGRSGATLVALSRFQITARHGAAPLLAGNLVTGGPGLPNISGRMESGASGAVLRLLMPEYRAGGSSLAVPSLILAQNPSGALGFVGLARVSGPLPGGSARGLVLPFDGNWSPRGGLALWRRCTQIAFDSLSYARLVLDKRSLTLCPQPGGAIFRSGEGATRFAVGAPSLNLAGHLGRTPIRIEAGPTGVAIPGVLAAKSVDVALGPAATASRFHLGTLEGRVGRTLAGTFTGAEMRLFAVQMNLLEGRGTWRYGGGLLSIAQADFRLVDRRPKARFAPLAGRDGNVTLRNNIVTGTAVLAEPASRREVTTVAIHHDLGTGRGTAELAMRGLTFDAAVQPATITPLARGVIADARGTLRGEGHIAWGPGGTTSTGRFTTDNLDFAAGFGPIKGASGTLVFTDLLNLVSAPDQHLHVASFNPGIEVTNGDVRYELRRGSQIGLLGATWPFLGGTLSLQPTTLNLGVTETRRYILKIDGLDAAQFVKRMELDDFSASGIFDGVLPLAFNSYGGRIENGELHSRPPGGSLSYTGQLSRKNLSTIANFAFDALKSLDYRSMDIQMNGALTGEIVTRVRFDQVRQGPGAKKNFITKRFAKLPIQFNINVRAPFYQLITMLKSMNDPRYTKDPRTIGLLDARGRPVRSAVSNPAPPAVKPKDIVPPPIKRSDSEKRP